MKLLSFSPAFWQEAYWIMAAKVLAVLFLTFVVRRYAQKLFTKWEGRLQSTAMAPEENPLAFLEHKKRIHTLLKSARYITQALILLFSAMAIISTLSLSLAPLWTALGATSLALGLAAQGWVKDLMAGILMVASNQMRIGDFVEVAGKQGVIEKMTFQFVQLRDREGFVHFIPNGYVTTITNRSYDFSYVVLDIERPFSAPLHSTLDLLQTTANEVMEAFKGTPHAPLGFDLEGLDRWHEGQMVFRCRFKAVPSSGALIKTAYLERLKIALERDEALGHG